MYSNNPLILQLLSLLKAFSINKIVISPGGRHVQLVLSLEKDDDFKLYSVVDERSAAFFALGLIQAYNEPVAVACTSGTACMNYGSAIAEAYYQRLPLLVLSADRLPALLNQGEEQMYNQLDPFRSITKYQVQLPEIQSDLDLWLCNRLINEALLELTNHGRGPVQINFPIKDIFGSGFDTETLPKVRKINFHNASSDFTDYAYKLYGKKILIIWGQSIEKLEAVGKAVVKFSRLHDCVVLTDCISNCPVENAIKNTFVTLQTLSISQQEKIAPDIIISIGGNQVFNTEIKELFKKHDFEHWIVGPQNKISDPFHKLTEIFEMDEQFFFVSMTSNFKNHENVSKRYLELWRELSAIPEPNLNEFNEVYAIGKLINTLPPKSHLQLSNSNTIRIASYFNIPSDIVVHCNRGVNGIDGSMSTAIGYASVQSNLTFYITGDLSFFYDMNSLWIKHITPNIRILLINNDGGSFMYSQRRIINGNPSLTLATNNHITAKGWAESTGFEYMHASCSKEYDDQIPQFISANHDKPVILEIDTSMADDRMAADAYIRSLDRRSTLEKVQGRISRSKLNIFK